MDSTHYSLDNTSTDLKSDHVLATAEALHQFLKHDLKTPGFTDRQLRIRIVPSLKEFRAEFEVRDMLPPGHEVQGYFFNSDKSVLVCDQGGAYDTRRVLVHELVHQFLSATGFEQHTPPKWCSEGYAEWVATHSFKDGLVQFGTRDRLLRYARGARLVRRSFSGAISVPDILANSPEDLYAHAWAFVTFLRESQWNLPSVRSWFFALLRGATAPLPLTPDGESILGEWERTFTGFVRDLRRPWVTKWGDWEHNATAIEGWDRQFAALEALSIDRSPSEVSCQVHVMEGRAGLVIAPDDGTGVVAIGLVRSGELGVYRLLVDTWETIATCTVQASDSYDLRVQCGVDGSLDVSSGSKVVLQRNLGQKYHWIGLYVSAGRAKFSSIVSR